MRLLALIVPLFFSSHALAGGPTWPITDIPRFWILAEDAHHFSLDGTFFRSEDNYDGDGQIVRPPAMDYVDYLSTRLHGAFGLTPRISFFAQADVRHLKTNTLLSVTPNETNFGFGDAFLAFRWLMHSTRDSGSPFPTEWTPRALSLILEGSWLFPLYNEAATGKPPLGDESNDLGLMARAVWYANEWLSFSGGIGYTYRTANYSGEIPWNLRADFTFLRDRRLRFWTDFLSNERATNTGTVLNDRHPDPVPGGSFLFKSREPTWRRVSFGAGYFLTRTWEIALGGLATASGLNAPKGLGVSLGVAWRPYEVREYAFEKKREQEQIRELRTPEILRERAARYDLRATILRVSVRGNFFKLGYGSNDGLAIGDTFQVFEPDDLTLREREPIALARVVAVRPASSFLRVEHRYADAKIVPGYEARRVDLDD